MITKKYKKIIHPKTAIGLSFGLIGGIGMSFLMTDPFELHYAGGYLLLIAMIIIILSAVIAYNFSGIGLKKYWNKVYVGFLAFFTTISTLRLSQVIGNNKTWELNKTDIIGSTII